MSSDRKKKIMFVKYMLLIEPPHVQCFKASFSLRLNHLLQLAQLNGAHGQLSNLMSVYNDQDLA